MDSQGTACFPMELMYSKQQHRLISASESHIHLHVRIKPRDLFKNNLAYDGQCERLFDFIWELRE